MGSLYTKRLRFAPVGVWGICCLLILTRTGWAAQHIVPTQFPTIQGAINTAAAGDDVLVLPGVYNELINLLGKAITLHSEQGPAETTIDATGLSGTVVTCNTGEGPTTVIRGFTITGGTGTVLGPIVGGGMLNGTASPTVVDCVFRDNTAQQGGGMWNNASSVRIVNCVFESNTGSFTGGGIWSFESDFTITNCLFNANDAVFAGGAIHNVTSSPTITNCTFSANSGGGVITSENLSIPVLTNSVIWGNFAAALDGDVFSHVVNYSDIQGSFPGVGNIAIDPLYADELGSDGIPGTGDEDLRLSTGSPCNDAGNNDAVPADGADLDEDGDSLERTPVDLDGSGRFTDDPASADSGNAGMNGPPIVSMGAYEFPHAVCGLSGDLNQDGLVNGDDIGGYVRAKLGQPSEPGEEPLCADFNTGSLEGDTAAFVGLLLQ
ncbi:MAG: right-handed parallel beta-helix repeat-containing protein [Phycisphaerae bacterium]